jgi:hypothetical protein
MMFRREPASRIEYSTIAVPVQQAAPAVRVASAEGEPHNTARKREERHDQSARRLL